MPFVLGELSKPRSSSTVHHIQDSFETEDLGDGDVVEMWDHVFEWDSDCVRASELESWRFHADRLCDDALREAFLTASSCTGKDLLAEIMCVAEANANGPAAAFMKHACDPLPESIRTTQTQLDLASRLYVERCMDINQALLNMSLAGGFSSPRITRVLRQVSYLVPRKSENVCPRSELDGIAECPHTKGGDQALTRLFETMQFVLDVMGCSTREDPSAIHFLAPGGEGWKSALRVRLLHGVARRRILDRSPQNGFSIEEEGLPINQEDLAATLAGSSIAPLICLTRLPHLSLPSPEEEQAYIDTWRHIGYYLGISPLILERHFANKKVATKFFASIVVHLFDSDEEAGRMAPTVDILKAATNRPPILGDFKFNCALTRQLLGDPLCDHLQVPRVTRVDITRMRLTLLLQRLPFFISQLYPRRG
ncbi:hypothetical protein SISNIDRAFT_480934 [Sistotremastrum niveocremeum HHB9708]|uniref:ER-bound oxygenase mpaB/mpaB'/Rubber oxygenase catalytic domain-containing protein n=1 Tax=Sistotremastrum niveocremeum HHB9708 TaxID=1314777 RepID=A0A164ZW95_9AGAM|nr:hypothetical protein SISNIDRAFT_480934 [Sistotremastrum niveocremeum HHB9708]